MNLRPQATPPVRARLAERYVSPERPRTAMLPAMRFRERAARLPLLLAFVALAAIPLAIPAAAAEAPNSLGLDATYAVSATLRWNAGKLVVSSAAHVTNSTDEAIPGFTFNFLPAKIGQIQVQQVLVGEAAATWRRDDQNVIVDLVEPLQPGGEATITIGYTATFATKPTNKKFLFEKKAGYVTAYRWIPWLSKRYSFKTPTFGEPWVTQATREVSVKLNSDNPAVKFATSGQLVASEGGTEEYVAHDVRDFNFSASPNYRVFSETYAGVQFDYYTVELSRSNLQSLTRSAYDKFTELVGNYPYSRLVVAETANGEGQESPGMIWIPRGTTKAGRKFLVRHEIAHQWFYAVVGNDQAKEPFADEALAELLTRTIVGHRDSRCGETTLDRSVYDYGASCYYEAVYVQGDQYLNEYRERVGNDAFWQGIRLYYERYAFKIGGTLELLNTLDEVAPEGLGGGHEERFPSLFPPPEEPPPG